MMEKCDEATYCPGPGNRRSGANSRKLLSPKVKFHTCIVHADENLPNIVRQSAAQSLSQNIHTPAAKRGQRSDTCIEFAKKSCHGLARELPSSSLSNGLASNNGSHRGDMFLLNGTLPNRAPWNQTAIKPASCKANCSWRKGTTFE